MNQTILDLVADCIRSMYVECSERGVFSLCSCCDGNRSMLMPFAADVRVSLHFAPNNALVWKAKFDTDTTIFVEIRFFTFLGFQITLLGGSKFESVR